MCQALPRHLKLTVQLLCLGSHIACLNQQMFHTGEHVLQFLFGSDTRKCGDLFTNNKSRSLFGIYSFSVIL